ncbi:hypothetical protein HW132_16130 [Brasilonema sp. CT11]|nr:hypothetical protein [Brasilonema sp. CT11]
MPSNQDNDNLLTEMLTWRINIFACAPEHIEAVADEFEILLNTVTPFLSVYTKDRDKNQRGVFLFQEPQKIDKIAPCEFLNLETIAALSENHFFFGEDNFQYGGIIKKLLLTRAQTYHSEISAVVFWTVPNKIGVALLELN